MSEQWIYLNGRYVNKNEAVVSVYDHGFLYGDRVFEGIRMYDGNVFRLKEHVDRLYDSGKSIMLDIPHTKEEVTEIIGETLDGMIFEMHIFEWLFREVLESGVGSK